MNDVKLSEMGCWKIDVGDGWIEKWVKVVNVESFF